MENIDEILNKAIQKATTDRGSISILIAGRSGVGKNYFNKCCFPKQDGGDGARSTGYKKYKKNY